MIMTRDDYELRRSELDKATTVALQDFEQAKQALARLHRDNLELESAWAVAEAQATATPGMWATSLNNSMMVAAAKVLNDAGHAAALIGGNSIGFCRGTGFFLSSRNRDGEVEVWHLVDGKDRKANGVDGWYEQLDAYRNAFRAAGWRIEWHSDVRSVHVTPKPADNR